MPCTDAAPQSTSDLMHHAAQGNSYALCVCLVKYIYWVSCCYIVHCCRRSTLNTCFQTIPHCQILIQICTLWILLTQYMDTQGHMTTPPPHRLHCVPYMTLLMFAFDSYIVWLPPIFKYTLVTLLCTILCMILHCCHLRWWAVTDTVIIVLSGTSSWLALICKTVYGLMGVEQWSANRIPSARKGEVCAFLSQETSKTGSKFTWMVLYYILLHRLEINLKTGWSPGPCHAGHRTH